MGQTVLVGTADGLHELGDSRRDLLDGHEVTSLARREPGWWAIIDQAEVWRSDSEGQWVLLASLDGLRANCILPTAKEVYVGTSEARLFVLHDDKLRPVESFDGAPGRESWYTPWGGPPDVRSMAADPSGNFYVNIHVGGVARSRVGDGSWEPTIELDADVHQVLFDPGSGLLLAASARGLADSGDEGASWVFDTEGLHGGYLRAVAVAGGSVLVSASTGPFTERAALYRKPLDGGETFGRCQNGLPEWFSDNIDTYCLAASGAAVAFGTSQGEAYLSSDEGESWKVLAEDLPAVRCVALP